MENPEVLIIGGGIGGSALATVLARAGISLLILEKSAVHIDHVRGEWIAPWGVAETQRLGLYDNPIEAGGHHLGEHITFGDDVDEATARAEAQNFSAFEGAGIKPPLCMRHPDMCNLLNATALKSGATMLREVGDVRVVSGNPPQVAFQACTRIDVVDMSYRQAVEAVGQACDRRGSRSVASLARRRGCD